MQYLRPHPAGPFFEAMKSYNMQCDFASNLAVVYATHVNIVLDAVIDQ